MKTKNRKSKVKINYNIIVSILSLTVAIIALLYNITKPDPEPNYLPISPSGIVPKYNVNLLSYKDCRHVLTKVKVNNNIFTIFEIIGIPNKSNVLKIKNKNGKNDYFYEYLFIRKSFILLINTNIEGIILYYSITSLDYNLNPELPIDISMRGKKNTLLNNIKFSMLGSKSLKEIYYNGSAKYIEYAEHEYFGNPGDYNEYHFGINPLGYQNEIHDNLLQKFVFNYEDKDDKYLTDSLIKFRDVATPNSFGVLNSISPDSLINYIIKGSIGPDYLDTRGIVD